MLLQLSRDCKVEVQRILHQRALDVKLDPDLQRRCMTDLGKWCSEKTEAGQELECLQDHLEDLVLNCRDVVGNLTELESVVNGHACISRRCSRFNADRRTTVSAGCFPGGCRKHPGVIASRQGESF